MNPGIHTERGYTIFELIATMSLLLVLGSIAVMNLKELDDPLANASAQLASFFKQARSRAVSTTFAYTVRPVSSDRIEVTYAPLCSDADQTDDTTLALDFPTGAYLTDSSWFLCYNARGLPDGNLSVEVYDGDGEYKTVEVFLGGGVRISD